MQISGDYTVQNSTLTLNYANNLYASTATTPTLKGNPSGNLTSGAVNQTVDANAVSQLIQVVYNGSQWVVTGPVSGALGSYASLSNTAVPASGTQFLPSPWPTGGRRPGTPLTSA